TYRPVSLRRRRRSVNYRGAPQLALHKVIRISNQNEAIGLSGEPVPPVNGIGAAVSRNSQRLRFAAASLKASRSQLSKRFTPSAINASWWIGSVRPSTPDGITSLAASLPSRATSRALSHFAHEACSHAEFTETFHGPDSALRGQRPLRM